MNIRCIPVFALLTACASASPGPGSSPGEAVLLHSAPTGPGVWTLADSTHISMDMNGQAMSVDIGLDGRLRIEYSGSDPLTATVTFESLNGAFSNPMSGTTRLSSADLPPPARLTVPPNGAASLMDAPRMSANLRQVFGAGVSFEGLFVRLPGRVVRAGTMWVDTVDTESEAAGMRTASRKVIQSTFTGDTVVDGRRLHVIQSSIASTVHVAGQNSGVEVRQSQTGESTALTLWDPQRRLLVLRIETGSAYGSLELPAMGISGIPVSSSTSRTMRLVGN